MVGGSGLADSAVVTTTQTVVVSFVAGLSVALLTAPVGVSGAVFLLPIQFSVLQIPSPAVTPINLLFNVIATPGALARYRRRARLRNALTTVLLVGTVPGVVIGALVRVFLIPGPRVFRLIAAAFLLPLGVWLVFRNRERVHGGSQRQDRLSNRFLALNAPLCRCLTGTARISPYLSMVCMNSSSLNPDFTCAGRDWYSTSVG